MVPRGLRSRSSSPLSPSRASRVARPSLDPALRPLTLLPSVLRSVSPIIPLIAHRFLAATYKLDMSAASNTTNMSKAISTGADKGVFALPKGASP